MSIKSFRDRNPIVIGVASVLVIALAVGAAYWVGVSHVFQPTYPVSGVFSDAGGISGNDPVLIAGVKVGRVTHVRAMQQPGLCARAIPDPNVVTPQGPSSGCVLVNFRVNKGIRVGSDAHAQIILQTLLGNRALSLTGPVTGPFMDNLPQASRVIPIDRTEVPFDIFDLTTVATRSIEATDTGKLNQLINQLANVTQGQRNQITTLLTSVSQVSSTLNARQAQVKDLIDRADKLSGQLANKDQTLVALIDQSQGILTEIQRRRNDISVGLTSANAAVAQLDSLISRDKANIDAVLSSLHPTLNTVSARQANINQALASLGPGLYTQGLAASHGPWADVFIKAIGPDLMACAQFLTGQVGAPPNPICNNPVLKGVLAPLTKLTNASLSALTGGQIGLPPGSPGNP
jgi:phospholipid/cholesterol/gamma-HCH transport system substrate-binding protein